MIGYSRLAPAFEKHISPSRFFLYDSPMTEREVTDLIDERDSLQRMCDALASRIAPPEVLGEHSSMNDPWRNALEYADAGAKEGARLFLAGITTYQKRN